MSESEYENQSGEKEKTWNEKLLDFGLFAGRIACQAIIMTATSYAFSSMLPRPVEADIVPLRKVS